MFKIKRELIIVFLLMIGACTLVASADQTNDSDKYTFTNYGGEVYTPEPMEFGANLNGNESVTLENGSTRKHMMLQFYENTTGEQIGLLDSYGLIYVKKATDYTFIFSMPADYTAADLPAESGLRWMGEIPIENKYDQNYGMNVPYYAKLEDGKVKLAVAFYEDVTSQDSVNILQKYSDNFSAPSFSAPWYYESITNETKINLIVNEDAVQLVGYYGVETIPVDSSDFVENGEVEYLADPDIVDEQEIEIQETIENNSGMVEKDSPGFTATIAILILALIAIFNRRKN